MNKIFRVIWSEAVQAWIAVSELTKSHQKSHSVSLSSARSAVIFPLKFFKLSCLSAALLSAGVSGVAVAADATSVTLETISQETEQGLLIGGKQAETLHAAVQKAKADLETAEAKLIESQKTGKGLTAAQRAVTAAENKYIEAVLAAKKWIEGEDQAKTVLSTKDVGRLLKANQIEYVSINSKNTAPNILNDGAQGENSIAIGPKASVAKEGKSGIAIGLAAAIEPGYYPIDTTFNDKRKRYTVTANKAVANVADNIVIGEAASSQYGSNNISIGKGAGQKYIIDVDTIKVKNTGGLELAGIKDASNTIAIGSDATTYDKDSIAIGVNAGKDSNFIDIRSMSPSITSAAGSILIGASTTLTSTNVGFAERNKGYNLNGSIAIGNIAKVDSNGPGSIALGENATAGGVGTDSSGIAIGYRANAKSINFVPKSDSGTEYIYANNSNNIAIGKNASAGLLVTRDNNGYTMTGMDVSLYKKSRNIPQDAPFSNDNYKVYGASGNTIAIGANTQAIGGSGIAIGNNVLAGPASLIISGSSVENVYDPRDKYLVATPDYKDDLSAFTYTDAGKHKYSDDTILDLFNRASVTTYNDSHRNSYAGKGSVALGIRSSAESELTTAIGYHSVVQVGSIGSVSIGAMSRAGINSPLSVTIGTGSISKGFGGIAIGAGSQANTTAVSIGTGSSAANNSVSIGQNSKTAYDSAVAVGYSSAAAGQQGTIAIGYKTVAKGDSSILLGGASTKEVAKHTVTYTDGDDPAAKYDEDTRTVTPIEKTKTLNEYFKYISGREVGLEPERDLAYVTNDALGVNALGVNNGGVNKFNEEMYSVGHGTVTMGVKAVAQGDLSVALGLGSWGKGLSSIALGAGAEATQQNSVAVGAGSTTEGYAGTHQPDVTIDGVKYKWAGGDRTDPGDVVSFGSKGYERQLKNIAAGEVSANSTDAVNGSQLFSFGRKITSLLNGNTGPVVYTDKDGNPLVSYTNPNTKETNYFLASAIDEKGILSATDKDGKALKGILVRDPTTNQTKIDYYNPDDLDSSGSPKEKAVAVTDVKYTEPSKVATLSLVNDKAAEGKLGTTSPKQLSNVGSNFTASTDNATSGSKPTGNVNLNNAATVGDVLNGGWNLQGSQGAVDFVQPFDTVKFDNGTGTTVSVQSNNDKSVNTISYSVNTTALENKDGKVQAGQKGNYFATAESVAKVINSVAKVIDEEVLPSLNNASWSIQGAQASGTSGQFAGENDAQNIAAGGQVGLQAGNNMMLDQVGSTFTYSLNRSLKDLEKAVFNTTDSSGKVVGSTTIDGVGTTMKAGDNVNTSSAAGNIVANGEQLTSTSAEGVEVVEGNNKAFTHAHGLTITAADGTTVALTDNGLNNGGKKLSHIAEGESDDDGVTVSQLKAAKAKVEGGGYLEVSAADNTEDSGKTYHVGLKTTEINTAKAVAGKLATINTAENGIATIMNVVNAINASGWNIAGNDKKVVETINPGEQINFLDGKLTKVSVEKDSATGNVNVKYDINVGAGLKVDNATIGIDTGSFKTENGKVVANSESDKAKLANVENIANAINRSSWSIQGAKASGTSGQFAGENDAQNIAAGGKVTLQAGNNMMLDQVGGTFTYSLNRSLKDLENAVFNTTDSSGKVVGSTTIDGVGTTIKAGDNVNTSSAAGNIVANGEQLTSTSAEGVEVVEGNNKAFTHAHGLTITAADGATVALTDNGLNNGGKKLSHIAEGEADDDGVTVSQLKAAKAKVEGGDYLEVSTTDNTEDGGKTYHVALKTADISLPSNGNGKLASIDTAKNGIVTAMNVVNAINASGWNIAGNDKKVVETINPGEQINFLDGKLTKVSVEKDSATGNVNVKYDVNVGAGLKVDNATIGIDTGSFKTENGKVVANSESDKAKLANVENIANAINRSSWSIQGAQASGTSGQFAGENDAQNIAAGGQVSLQAGNNMMLDQVGSTFTYSLNRSLKDLENAVFNTTDSSGKVVGSTTIDGVGTTMKAGDNVNTSSAAGNIVANGDSLTSTSAEGVEVVEGDNKALIHAHGLTITAADGSTISLTDKGLDNGGRTITHVSSHLSHYTEGDKEGLLNLENVNANHNAAATTEDLRGIGWLISAEKETGSATNESYHDQVRHTNKVSFKGSNGIEVTGKTVGDTREITVSIKEGEVAKANSNFVTGDKVANAIEKSGWTLGKASEEQLAKAKASGDEKVNPDDVVRFANGKNTKVNIGRFDQTDAKGKTTSTTVISTDVDLPVSEIQTLSRDANGRQVVKANDGKWYEATQIDDKGLVKDPEKSTALSESDIARIHTDHVVLLDPENTVPSYNRATDRLTETDTSAIEKAQTAATLTPAVMSAKTEVAKALAGQDPDIIQKAMNAIDLAAKTEAKEKYLHEHHLNQGNGGTVISNLAWGSAPSDAVNVDQLQHSGFNVDAHAVEGTNGKVISANHKATKVRMDETLNINAGNNVEIIRSGRDVAIAVSRTPTVDELQIGQGDYKVKLTTSNGALNVNGAKITHIAAGEISRESTEAINGSQLYAITGNISENGEVKLTNRQYRNSETQTVHIDKGDNQRIERSQTVVTDKEGNPFMRTYNVSGQREIITNNVFEAIQNINEQGIKFFHSNDGKARSKWEDQNTFDSSASGQFATAIGAKSHAEGKNAIAIGYGSKAIGQDTISIGTGNEVHGDHSGAIGDPSIINGNSSYSVGNNNRVNTDHTFVLGNDVTHTIANSVFLGSQSSYVAANTNAKGVIDEATSTTAGTQALAQYAGGAQNEVVGVVSLGTVGVDAQSKPVQQTRRLQNVAPGLIAEKSTDAINGSQLHQLSKGVVQNMDRLDRKVHKLGKRMDAGVAGAMAAANLPQAYRSGQSSVAAAVGQHRRQAALAVGYSRLSDNGKYGVKLSLGADTQGEVSSGAGVAYFW